MATVELKKGQLLHKCGDEISTVEIVFKGALSAVCSHHTLVYQVGDIIGHTCKPGSLYPADIAADTDTTVGSYACVNEKDFLRILEANPQILPILATASVRAVLRAAHTLDTLYSDAALAYTKLMDDFHEYPSLCPIAGETPRNFPGIDALLAPSRGYSLPEYKANELTVMDTRNAFLQKNYFALDPALGIGAITDNYELISQIFSHCERLEKYAAGFEIAAYPFRTTLKRVKDKIANPGALDAGIIVSDITGALHSIIEYARDGDAAISDGEAMKFTSLIGEYKKITDRSAYSDAFRAIRKEISELFYRVYTACFVRSRAEGTAPDIIMLLLNFGFVDEELAGDEYTSSLLRIYRGYMPDPQGRVLTMYEWLTKIYQLEIEPSRNEFNLDYPAYLRDCRKNGDIDDEQVKLLMDDPLERLRFEVKNLFNLGNRMTSGRPTSFVPFFDASNCLKAPTESYSFAMNIHKAASSLTDADYGIFMRETSYSNPRIGINQFFYQKEILPYFVLTPSIGTKCVLWQEIEGKKRDTAARFLLPVFMDDDLEKSMLRAFGDYRWEMCKTVQGVHWNDLSDPSLTAEYCDYLQFYKKNRNLSEDQREKVAGELKKYANNYKNLFISNYMTYMTFERKASLRLNKIAREILFKYCTFSKEVRDSLKDNPQYATLIKQYDAGTADSLHALEMYESKILKGGFEVPDIFKAQRDYYGM